MGGEEKEAVESLVTKFNILANGRIEKVMQIDTKKGAPVLLVQFDSSEYRDEVLKGSRRPEARSQSSVRFRRPKVKDLKQDVVKYFRVQCYQKISFFSFHNWGLLPYCPD